MGKRNEFKMLLDRVRAKDAEEIKIDFDQMHQELGEVLDLYKMSLTERGQWLQDLYSFLCEEYDSPLEFHLAIAVIKYFTIKEHRLASRFRGCFVGHIADIQLIKLYLEVADFRATL